ncbi:hypothetical protein M3Y94_00914300 [Aphelenchoides besseyi]|nr:hypothetical protein M3Y94_00914300 [Aphelenchoides besseyi]
MIFNCSLLLICSALIVVSSFQHDNEVNAVVSGPLQRRSYVMPWNSRDDPLSRFDWPNLEWANKPIQWQQHVVNPYGQLNGPSLLTRHWQQKRAAAKRERILDSLGGDFLIRK